jgi:anti-sigma factor RsiW
MTGARGGFALDWRNQERRPASKKAYGADRVASVTCREFADFMADYLSGELQRDIRQQFDRHLGLCVNCQRYLGSYKETIALGKYALADDDSALPVDVPEELVRAILAARPHR